MWFLSTKMHTTLHTIDWILITLPLLIILAVAIYTQRYMKSVSGFLSGNRMAERYLLAVSRGEMQAGAVVFVALFEVLHKSGFTLQWWGWITAPALMVVGITGFIFYRYRETRAMTLAQFFEIRYSKSFRIFAGIVGFLAGITNFGIIPAVGARFFVHFLGMPVSIHLFGAEIPTFVLLMAIFLLISLTITLAGGLITVMVTDCVEGIMSQILYLVIIFGLLKMVSWDEISFVLSHRPPGESLINPFDSLGLKDFNIWFSIMGLALAIYGTMAWQNQSAYNSASLTAHESRMGSLLGHWREMGKGAVITLLGICAMTYLYHPDFSAQATAIQADIHQISEPRIQEQMTIPTALAHMLPVGLKGALCIILLMGIFGGDGTHLHSWGSLFVQDILVPLRKKPLTPRQHILWLRIAITGVAVWAFAFGSLFRQTEYIMMWWAVTTAIFVGGAGAVIIGGLYWKKGTTTAAWVAMITGSGLSAGGILIRQFHEFPLNGMQISFFASIIAILLYIVISLLTCKEDFNMDRMLHRGTYAKKSGPAEAAPAKKTKLPWGRIIGFDHNFTLSDKWVAGGLFGWSMLWLLIFAIGTAWNCISPWPTQVWSTFWHIVAIGIPVCFTIITGIWFTWGGIHDMTNLFRRLSQQKDNPLDNGMVVNHQNLDDTH